MARVSPHRRAAGLALPLLAVLASTAFSAPNARADVIPSDSFWIHGGVGMTFASSTTLSFSAAEQPVISGAGLQPSVLVGVHYRTSVFDVGFIAGGLGSGVIRGQERERYAGAKGRLCASVRWRYIDANWGSLFVRLAPGVAFLEHSDFMRSEVTLALGNPADRIEAVDEYNIAFTLGSALGANINLERWLTLYLEVEVVTTLTEMQDGDDLVGYTAIQPVIAIGFEARLN